MRSRVPGFAQRRSLRMSALRIRMQPCETARPMSHGWLVPWMPMTPPPGHSDSREYAAVPNASGP